MWREESEAERVSGGGWTDMGRGLTLTGAEQSERQRGREDLGGRGELEGSRWQTGAGTEEEAELKQKKWCV